jgi:hypothetical protein
VPRTPDLNLAVSAFQAAVDQIAATWGIQHSHRASLGAGTVRAASEAALTGVATQWEFFRSEWHKKAIARDASQYRDELSRRIRVLASESDGGRDLVTAIRDLGLQVEINLPKYPTIETVNRLRDSREQNIAFRSKKDSDEVAGRDLVDAYSVKVRSLDHDDWAVIGLMIALRNALAHSSIMSMNAMNAAIRAVASTRQRELRQLARDVNRVTASGIGAYLASSITWRGSDVARVMVITDYMRNLGDKFRN